MKLLYSFPTVIAHGTGGQISLDWRGLDPFSQSPELHVNGAVAFPQLLPGAFSADECDRIVALGESRITTGAAVDQRSDLASRDYRISDVAWIEPAQDAHWLYHRLAVLFAQVNESFGFDLTGFAEALQFTCYGPGQYFGWHADIGGDDTAARKLSLTIQLSDPADYDGGNLQFHGADDLPAARGRGCVTIFPAYLAHQVSPVTRGLRRSLVAWAYGPSFR